MLRLSTILILLYNIKEMQQQSTILPSLAEPPRHSCIYDKNSKTRKFSSLDEYQSNIISFYPEDKDYQGQIVTFNTDNIDSIPENGLSTHTAEYVSTINLINKGIRCIDGTAFSNYFCLRHLDLSGNKLSTLNNDPFRGLENLRSLNLSGNKIPIIPNYAFEDLGSLITLDLSYNKVSDIERHGLSNLTSLERLFMTHNKMRMIRYNLFDSLVKLRELDLSWNNIELFIANLFGKLKELEKMDLSGNNAEIYNVQFPSILHNLTFLNLSSNSLFQLNVRSLRKHYPNRSFTLDINKNEFYCSELEIVLHEIHLFKINLIPGENQNALHHREHIICDPSSPSTDGFDNYPEEHSSSSESGTSKDTSSTPASVVPNSTQEDMYERKREIIITALVIFLFGLIMGCAFFCFADWAIGYGMFRRSWQRLRREDVIEMNQVVSEDAEDTVEPIAGPSGAHDVNGENADVQLVDTSYDDGPSKEPVVVTSKRKSFTNDEEGMATSKV